MRSLLLHTLPALLTAALFVLVPLLCTAPMAAVFLIDDAFVVSDYIRFVALLGGIAVGLVGLIILPLAALIDFRWNHPRPLALAAPLIPAPVLFGLGAFRNRVLHIPLQEVVAGWNGIACAMAFLLGVYWTVLLSEKALLRLLGRGRRSVPNAR